MACVDAMSVSAKACADNRRQACVAERTAFTVLQLFSSSSGQNSYGDLAACMAALLEVDILTGRWDNVSAMVLSPPLM